MSDLELKPCPFCGNKRITVMTISTEIKRTGMERPSAYYVKCKRCGVETMPISTRDANTPEDRQKRLDAAIDLWNRRVE